MIRINLLVIFTLLLLATSTQSISNRELIGLFSSSSSPFNHNSGSPIRSFHKKQLSLIKGDRKLLNAIKRGLRMAIKECQHQFKERHWNCPLIDSEGNWIFGKISRKGCRESAFVYAITAAGVAHAVASACGEGTIRKCSCNYRRARYSNSVDMQWEGCSDNIDFGYRFAKKFVDIAERGRDLKYLINLHNNEAGRLLGGARIKVNCDGNNCNYHLLS